MRKSAVMSSDTALMLTAPGPTTGRRRRSARPRGGPVPSVPARPVPGRCDAVPAAGRARRSLRARGGRCRPRDGGAARSGPGRSGAGRAR
ncbi:hypothetical protein G6F66_015632 [Rhizopus arrhizus]|nr:hypothetical protein G6F66_015632 [Rhizopus arrhizus]